MTCTHDLPSQQENEFFFFEEKSFNNVTLCCELSRHFFSWSLLATIQFFYHGFAVIFCRHEWTADLTSKML